MENNRVQGSYGLMQLTRALKANVGGERNASAFS